jgi:hypothetical protein
MRHSTYLAVFVAAAAILCRITATHAADEGVKQGNAVERTAKKVTKAVERAGKATVNAIDRGTKAVDKALTNAGEKTEAWVKSKTK